MHGRGVVGCRSAREQDPRHAVPVRSLTYFRPVRSHGTKVKRGMEEEMNEGKDVRHDAKNDDKNCYHVLIDVVKHDEESNVFLSVKLAPSKSECTFRGLNILVGSSRASTKEISDGEVEVCGGSHDGQGSAR